MSFLYQKSSDGHWKMIHAVQAPSFFWSLWEKKYRPQEFHSSSSFAFKGKGYALKSAVATERPGGLIRIKFYEFPIDLLELDHQKYFGMSYDRTRFVKSRMNPKKEGTPRPSAYVNIKRSTSGEVESFIVGFSMGKEKDRVTVPLAEKKNLQLSIEKGFLKIKSGMEGQGGNGLGWKFSLNTPLLKQGL